MPLPRKGDPRRPLHLAIRSMRLLGGLLLLFSTCMTVPFFLRGGAGGGTPLVPLYFVFAFLIYLLPGACFIVFSIYLARRQFWAVVASISLASLVALFGLIGVVGLALAMMTARDSAAFMLIPLGVACLIVLALGQLIYHLAKSFEAIKHVAPEESGFEPLMAQPIAPPPPASERADPPAAG